MEIENCEFGEFKWTVSLKPFYTCKVTSCNITSRGSAVAAFKGDHAAKRTNDCVTALLFTEKSKVQYFPKNLSEIFPNLQHLSIYKCELKEISAEDLVGLEKLESLYFKDNEITTLPVDLFKNMTNLKEVSLRGNRIQNFDVAILEPIKHKIEYFSTARNPGIDRIFDKKSGILEFIKNLELLKAKEMDSKRFVDVFENGKHSDVTVKVDGKAYRVHKVILSTLSPVFDKMFTDGIEVLSKTLDSIRNYTQGAIEEFLRYFYTKNTPSKEHAVELFELAGKFEVPGLKLQCESILMQSVEPQSARKLYNFAVRNSLENLKRKSFEAIKECQPEIADYIYNKPKLVNQLIEAKEEARDEIQKKKIKLEKEEN